jgi:hypothetical protein
MCSGILPISSARKKWLSGYRRQREVRGCFFGVSRQKNTPHICHPQRLFPKNQIDFEKLCVDFMAFSRKLDKRDFRKQWHTFSPNQLQNTGDDLPPSRRRMNWDTSGKQRGGEFEGWGE